MDSESVMQAEKREAVAVRSFPVASNLRQTVYHAIYPFHRDCTLAPLHDRTVNKW
jgi:hypothetical protein